MEWQAGYACGAFLMPVTHVRRRIAEYQQKHNIYGAVLADSDHGRAMIQLTKVGFAVSDDAARVRLSVLGVLGKVDNGPSLFG
jgi:hypothetical protein